MNDLLSLMKQPSSSNPVLNTFFRLYPPQRITVNMAANLKSITIFGDIHANLPVLGAIFRDIETRNLTSVYCLGDLVGYGIFSNEVVNLNRERCIPTLMGNYDQGVGNDSDDCGCAYKTDVDRKRGELSTAWSNAHTTEEN